MSGGAFWADLRFEGDFDAELTETLVVGALSWMVSERVDLGLSIGAIVDGELTALGRIHDINPGLVAAVKASYRIFNAPQDPLSLTFTAAFGASFTSTTARDNGDKQSLTATDLRLALTASRTFGGVFTPWLSARVFGGPVLWNNGSGDVTGSDPGHHQLALGSALALGPVSVSLEWAFLGERALFGAVNIAF